MKVDSDRSPCNECTNNPERCARWMGNGVILEEIGHAVLSYLDNRLSVHNV